MTHATTGAPGALDPQDEPRAPAMREASARAVLVRRRLRAEASSTHAGWVRIVNAQGNAIGLQVPADVGGEALAAVLSYGDQRHFQGSVEGAAQARAHLRGVLDAEDKRESTTPAALAEFAGEPDASRSSLPNAARRLVLAQDALAEFMARPVGSALERARLQDAVDAANEAARSALAIAAVAEDAQGMVMHLYDALAAASDVVDALPEERHAFEHELACARTFLGLPKLPKRPARRPRRE